MDLMMPKLNGADATSAILATNPEVGVVILSSFVDSFDMARAISNGARGAQAKESPTETLIESVQTVANGGTAIAPDIMRHVKENPLPPPLTEKQLAILSSVTRGLTNQDIALEFGISAVVVKSSSRRYSPSPYSVDAIFSPLRKTSPTAMTPSNSAKTRLPFHPGSALKWRRYHATLSGL